MQLAPRRAVVGPQGLGQSGNAGAYREPAGESRHRTLDPRRDLGTLGARPDQAHLAPQHVDDLRQLVEVVAAQHPPDPGRAHIAPRREHGSARPLGVRHHGAELEHREHGPAAPQPALAVQHRRAVVEKDGDGDGGPEREPQRPEQGNGQSDEREVEGPLVAPAGRRAGGVAGLMPRRVVAAFQGMRPC